LSVGCPCLRNETQRISVFIKRNGFLQTEDPLVADYLILAGCAVTDRAEKISLQRILEARNVAKKNSIKIIYGCVSTIAEKTCKKYTDLILIKHGEEQKFNEIFSAAEKIDDIICNGGKETVCDNFINSATNSSAAVFRPLSEEKQEQKKLCEDLDKLHKTNLFTEAFEFCTKINPFFDGADDIFEIKIGTGCLGNCSYCAIKNAKGLLKSVSADKIIMQVKNGITNNYKKFMLIADECGHWGADIKDDFCNLLDKISDISRETKIPIKLMILGLHPDKLISSYERLLPHFLSGLIFSVAISFQTGSQKIMKLMNRRTDIKKLKLILQDMHNKKVSAYLIGGVIVGFPSETEEDFYSTIEFMRDTYFDRIEVNGFSPRPETAALKFKHQLSPQEIERREQTTRQYLKAFRSKQLLYRITTIFNEIKK
jgi:tRNA A37 methylthiotransferase MiaB